MRLESSEINDIKQCIHDIDVQAKVYLFGSRMDDHKKGGDIDLLIISNKIDFTEKLKLQICMKEKLGEQKIDIVTSSNTTAPFTALALESAIQL